MSTRTNRPVTDERKRIFIDVLSRTGSMSAAAAAATPHGESAEGRPGYTSFRDEIKRNPEFAAEVDEAKNRALARVEEAIAERAFTLDEKPIFDKEGRQVGVQVDRRNANMMLLRLASKLDPDSWADRRKIDGSVKHEHEHRHSHGFEFTLRAEHLSLLPEAARHQLVDLLDLIENRLEQK